MRRETADAVGPSPTVAGTHPSGSARAGTATPALGPARRWASALPGFLETSPPANHIPPAEESRSCPRRPDAVLPLRDVVALPETSEASASRLAR